MNVGVRAITATVLLLSGVAKLRDADQFARIVLGYAIVSWPSARIVARTLSPLEVLLAVGIVTGLASPLPELVSALLFATFALALGSNLARGRRDLDCGCFGVGGGAHRGITWWHPLRAVALGAMAVAAATLGRPDGREAVAAAALVAVAATIVGAVTTIRALTSSSSVTATS